MGGNKNNGKKSVETTTVFFWWSTLVVARGMTVAESSMKRSSDMQYEVHSVLEEQGRQAKLMNAVRACV